MIYSISRGLRRAECLVYILPSQRYSKRLSDDNLMLHYRPCNFVQNSFRTLTTSSPSDLPGKHSLTSTVAEDILSHIKTFGIDEDEISSHPQLSKLPLEVIQLRLQFCSEGGLIPSIKCVTEFEYIAESSLSELKSSGILPHETDVVERILASVNFKGPPPLHIMKHASYASIHFQTVCHCMKSFYGFSYPIWKCYSHASIVFTLDNIRRMMDLNMSADWIRFRSSFICCANPNNLQRLCELERLYELPITLNKIIAWNSYLLVTNFEDVRSAFFILMKNKVCRHDLVSTKKAETFLISPHVLEKHFQKIRTESDPSINRLALLYKKKYIALQKPKKGIQLNQEISIQQIYPRAPIDSLQESWQHDMKLWLESKSNILEYKPCRHDESLLSRHNNKRIKDNNSESLICAIAYELSITKTLVRTEFSRIPLGLKVPGEEACNTLKFLLESGFTKGEIKESLQLLLYPREVVRDALDLHVIPDPVYGVSAHRKRRLQLCLCHILLKYNYSLPDASAL